MKNTFLALGIWLSLVMTHLAEAQENLVMNGGFNGNWNGWTITNTPYGIGYHSQVRNPPGAIQLDDAYTTPGVDPTASQTITNLVLNQSYLISGEYRQGKIRGTNLPLDVPSFGVALNGDYLFTAYSPGNIPDWTQFRFFYTASSSMALLSISSQINGTGVSYDVDNIAMYALPEPSSAILVVFGAVLGMFCRRTFGP
jgi:hypothetical protein